MAIYVHPHHVSLESITSNRILRRVLIVVSLSFLALDAPVNKIFNSLENEQNSHSDRG